MRSAYLAKRVTSVAIRALNYAPEAEAVKDKADFKRAVCFGDVLRLTGSSYGKVFIRYDCKPSVGAELVTQADIFAAEPEGRFIRGEAIRNLEEHRIHRWQVLIAGAGQMEETNLFGRSIIADERLIGKIVSPHILRLSPVDDLDTALYTYAFLCSKIGIRMVHSCAYGSSVPSISSDLLLALPIPLADDTTLKKIADLIRITVNERERYVREAQFGRLCLEALPEMQEAIAMCQERRARCALWDGELPTMTGWTYASTGRALSYLRKRWTARLGDFIQPGGLLYGPRSSRTRCQPPYGIDFWSQRDLHLIRPIPFRIPTPKQQDSGLLVPENTLLIASRGQFTEGALFGKVTIATAEMAKVAITGDAVRLHILPEYALQLYAFLSTSIGLRLLRTSAVGNSIPMMRLDLVKNLPVPTLDSSISQQVNTHVKNALEARVTAANAEKEAVRIIEEEVLPEWLA